MREYIRTVDHWAKQVVEGRVLTCRSVQLACQRHLTLWNRQDIDRRLDEVQRAFGFIEALRHSVGLHAGRRFQLALWQQMIVADLFGLYQDGKRLFRRAFISLPRKNGKTTFASAIALKLLVADSEPGPQVLLAGASREQARIALQSAKNMILATEVLRDRLAIKRTSIECEANGGLILALSGEDRYAFGYHASGAVVDELHAHHDRSLWDVVDTSTVGRVQPLVLVISTAGEDVGQIYQQLRAYSEDVLVGEKADDRWYAFIAAADSGDSWDTPTTWAKANPNLGLTVQEEELAAIARRAAGSPLAQLTFRRLHLNEMLGDCGQWIPLEVWREQALQQPPVPPSSEATIGLDLASHVDLAAAVEARRCGEGYWITYHAWASGRAMRESVAARQLQRAHALGMLEASMADAIDFSSIRAWLRLARERGARWLVADPAGAMHLLAEVVADGWPQEQVIEYPQSAAYMDPLIRRVQTLAMEKKLWHQASPLWDLCLGNVRVGQDARGRAYFHKGRSEGPIDLAVALTLAVGWEPPVESAVKPWVEVL